MQVVDNLRGVQPDRGMILTVGAYDGLHRGHQALLSKLIRHSRCSGYLSGLITFHPHPRAVLQTGYHVQYLTTPGEKAALLERMDLDTLVVLRFSQDLASMSPRDFVLSLCDHLQMRELWVGEDFALGRNREGNVHTLRALGAELGFEVRAVETVVLDGIPVRSSSIRDLLGKGEVARASQMLGRYYSLSGEIVQGAQRGRCMGFPTANLAVREERVVPADGVYATCALLGTERYHSVTNIGVRPSFDDAERTIEVHILDLDEGLYGQDLVVEYVRRLRPERRFQTIDDLVAQLHRDVERARGVLGVECPLNAEASRSQVEPVSGYEEVEHTADVALRVWADDLKSLFIEAASGMFQLIGECDADSPHIRNHIKLEAPDAEALLVDWLNELLYLHEVQTACYCCFDVRGFTTTSIVADVAGNALDSERKAVKAATFHDLRIRRTSTGYETVVVFDV